MLNETQTSDPAGAVAIITKRENVLEYIRQLIDERMELAKRLADVDRLLREAMEHGRRF